jgi:hypothetical protein
MESVVGYLAWPCAETLIRRDRAGDGATGLRAVQYGVSAWNRTDIVVRTGLRARSPGGRIGSIALMIPVIPANKPKGRPKAPFPTGDQHRSDSESTGSVTPETYKH